jgi:hypothetical protein
MPAACSASASSPPLEPDHALAGPRRREHRVGDRRMPLGVARTKRGNAYALSFGRSVLQKYERHQLVVQHQVRATEHLGGTQR